MSQRQQREWALLSTTFFYCAGLRWVVWCLPTWGAPSSLLCLLIQMLISSRDPLTDIPQNYVLPAIWWPLGSVKRTHKTNHHTVEAQEEDVPSHSNVSSFSSHPWPSLELHHSEANNLIPQSQSPSLKSLALTCSSLGMSLFEKTNNIFTFCTVVASCLHCPQK